VAALYDSGSTIIWIYRSASPNGVVPYNVARQRSSTLAGTSESSLIVRVSNVLVPRFSRLRRIDSFEARIIETPCRHDIILDRQDLTKFAIDLSFSDLLDQLADVRRPMSTTTSLKTVRNDSLATKVHLNLLLEDGNDDAFGSDINPFDNKKVQVRKVADSCKHPSTRKGGYFPSLLQARDIVQWQARASPA
jgi:hypothetical protein